MTEDLEIDEHVSIGSASYNGRGEIGSFDHTDGISTPAQPHTNLRLSREPHPICMYGGEQDNIG